MTVLIVSQLQHKEIPELKIKYNGNIEMIERLDLIDLNNYTTCFILCKVTLDQLYTIFSKISKGGKLYYSEEDALLLTGCEDVVYSDNLYCGRVPEYDLDFEEQLLTKEDKEKPTYSENVKRQPCANCNCGLKEELESTVVVDMADKKSGCGNCSLGDAFRCASCPYLGMPAFKPGQDIKLTGMFAEDDL